MGAIVELILFAVICASVGGVQGVCNRVMNEEMVEYTCEGGQPSDLYDLPESTEKIRIINMPISRITADTFSRFGSNLWVLSCTQCQIHDIDPDAFRRMNNLQQLSLDNNYLTTVKESWFRGLTSLTYLNLNYNYIDSIEDGMYTNLPSLIDLRLSGNRLECLNLKALSNLRDLERMYLGENSQFKCPNAISKYLESRKVNFDRDPEWENIPNDLVPAEVPDGGVDFERSTTSLPVYRERLRPAQPAPSPPPVESTESSVPPKLHTTEEVLYHPVYTPNWRTTPSPVTDDYEDTEGSIELYTDPIMPYFPPRTIAPIDAPHETTQYNNQDATTSRSWPRFPESSSARPEYPLYPPHGNEDRRNEEQYYSSEATNTFPLAPGPPDRHETPSFVESDVEHTSSGSNDWLERNTVPVDNSPPEYRVPPGPDSTHAIQPLPPTSPGTVYPVLPDNTFQAPYYEHPITVHSPPMVNNQPSQEELSPVTMLVETTTDKPLPNCPSSSSSFYQTSLGTIVVTLLFITIGRVLVEGF